MTDFPQTVYVRPPVWALIVAVLIGGGFYVYGKHLDRSAPVPLTPPSISVSGDGKVSVAPDIVVLNFGVATGRMTTAKAAMTKVAENMSKVIEAVKAQGIEERDIRTEGFYLSPEYDYSNGTQVLRGYQATQSLTAKVRDLDKTGDVLTAATNAGANQAGGVSFSVDKPEEAKAEARNEAIEEAKEKAKIIADGLGMSLGNITAFFENESGVSPPMPYMARDMAMEGMATKSVELPAGEQEIVVSVTITYELK